MPLFNPNMPFITPGSDVNNVEKALPILITFKVVSANITFLVALIKANNKPVVANIAIFHFPKALILSTIALVKL